MKVPESTEYVSTSTVPLGGKYSEMWIRDFLQGVESVCLVIDGPGDDEDGVEPNYDPNKDMDTILATVVYLSAWRVPGHQAGEEFVHWVAFKPGGQPPPRTGNDTDRMRFPWGRSPAPKSTS